jgi:NADH:ubiquinone oxidoreductase subunit F (NADH-binding)
MSIIPHVASFYHRTSPMPPCDECRGLACFVARPRNSARWDRAIAQTTRTYCLGRCYEAPASAEGVSRPCVQIASREGVVLSRLARGDHSDIDAYRRTGGYQAVQDAYARPPWQVIASVEESALRGRGGAGFPAGAKWRAVAAHGHSPAKYVIANGDEGDPGAYMDRLILEEDPHVVIEGLMIAAYAVGAGKGLVYVRGEYPTAVAKMEAAIVAARNAGVLRARPGPAGDGFDIEVVAGAGSYVCGEETAMLNAIEGRRGDVRARPPYPAEQGLFGRPTLVHNIETLASIVWLVKEGPERYRALGTATSRGTKVVSLNSLFRRPGLYEIEFGVPVRHIVEDLGGWLADGRLKGVLIGPPLAGIVPPHLLDTAFGFDELRAIGAGVGHGGVVAFDDRTSIRDLMHHVFEFGAFESCGKCTPCRVGTRRIADGLAPGRPSSVRRVPLTRRRWDEVVAALSLASLCGHGSGLAEFAESVARHYPEELASCLV